MIFSDEGVSGLAQGTRSAESIEGIVGNCKAFALSTYIRRWKAITPENSHSPQFIVVVKALVNDLVILVGLGREGSLEGGREGEGENHTHSMRDLRCTTHRMRSELSPCDFNSDCVVTCA